MLRNEHSEQTSPRDTQPTKPIAFGDFFTRSGEGNQEKTVGVVPLITSNDLRNRWITGFRAWLPGETESYSNDGNSAELPVRKFKVKKLGEDGVKIQLRALKGVQATITIELRPDQAEIVFPLKFAENPLPVIKRLGPTFFASIPSKIRKQYSENISQKEDAALSERLEEILINRFDGIANPEDLARAYERAFHEPLPKSAQATVVQAIEKSKNNQNLIRDKWDL